MPGRVPADSFVSLQVEQEDPDFLSEVEFDDTGEKTCEKPQAIETYSVDIPPRTGPSTKRKKSKNKNRRRHSETIWTIVSEQENPHQHQQQQQQPHYATTGKLPKLKKSKKAKGKDKDRSFFSLSSPQSSSPHKGDKKKGNLKKNKKSGDGGEEVTRKISFLDNPIFESELKNWTLPRAELWCRDPNCQINLQLWRDYCQSHQNQLTQLQFQELQEQNQHYQHTRLQHFQPHHYHHPHQHYQQLQRRSLTAEPILLLPSDLPPPHTFSRRQRVSSFSNYFSDDAGEEGRAGAVSGAECYLHQIYNIEQVDQVDTSHYQHHPPEPLPRTHRKKVSPPKDGHGNTQITMSIGHSVNNLNQAPPDSTPGRMGVSRTVTPTSPTNKNIVPTAPSSSSSGVSSSGKTGSTQMQSSSSSTSSGGLGGSAIQVTSSSSSSHHGGKSGAGEEHDAGGSYSSSNSSGSSEDVSSGSTFVTGFDSSESRGSSVPSSLNKPPHPSLLNPNTSGGGGGGDSTRDRDHHHQQSNSNNYHHYNNSTNHKSHNTNRHHHRNSSSNTNSKSQSQNYGDTSSIANTGGYTLPYMPTGYRKPGICPSCNGLVPPPSASTLTNHHLVPVDPLMQVAAAGGGVGGAGPLDIPHHPQHHHLHTTTLPNSGLKSENNCNNAFWNFAKFQHPLQRDHSFHSVGGFTLNGQYNTQVKKRRVVKFCSSHKIALVVSTFSLMVTIGLIITLILMKKRGMMDTMDMMPT